MSYEVTTPVLKKVCEGLGGVFDAAIEGKADIRQGNLAVNAGSAMTRAVGIDLRARLARRALDDAENPDHVIEGKRAA